MNPTRILSVAGILFLLGFAAAAAPMPLKEVEFLLRQQQPEAEIVREINQRRLTEVADAEWQAKLRKAGASSELIQLLQKPELRISEEEAKELAAAREKMTARNTPAKSDPPAVAEPSADNDSDSMVPSTVKIIPGTVAAALKGKTFTGHNQKLSVTWLPFFHAPKGYIFFFSVNYDKSSDKFMRSLHRRHSNFNIDSPFLPIEICRVRTDEELYDHLMRLGEIGVVARYSNLDPRIQELCPKSETRIVLITQDWKVLVNEVAPPAEMALKKVDAAIAEYTK